MWTVGRTPWVFLRSWTRTSSIDHFVSVVCKWKLSFSCCGLRSLVKPMYRSSFLQANWWACKRIYSVFPHIYICVCITHTRTSQSFISFFIDFAMYVDPVRVLNIDSGQSCRRHRFRPAELWCFGWWGILKSPWVSILSHDLISLMIWMIWPWLRKLPLTQGSSPFRCSPEASSLSKTADDGGVPAEVQWLASLDVFWNCRRLQKSLATNHIPTCRPWTLPLGMSAGQAPRVEAVSWPRDPWGWRNIHIYIIWLYI